MCLPVSYRGKPWQCPQCQAPFTPGRAAAARPEAVPALEYADGSEARPRQPERRRPRPGEPTVQCYDCRYTVPVDDSMSMTVNTGHSTGNISGSTVGVGGSLGGGLGAGAGRFGGTSSSEHFGKVDLCVPCCQDRLARLRKKLAEVKATALGSFVLFTFLGLIFGIWQGSALGGFLGGMFVSVFIAAGVYAPAGAIQNQINSAVRNGRGRAVHA